MDNDTAGPLYTEAFAYDIALQFFSPEEVCEAHDVAWDHYTRLKEFPLFQKSVSEHIQTIKSKGVTLQMKAMMTAEEMLPELFRVFRDPETPPQTKSMIAKQVGDWAQLGGKPEGESAPVAMLTFVLPELEQKQVVVEETQVLEMPALEMSDG